MSLVKIYVLLLAFAGLGLVKLESEILPSITGGINSLPGEFPSAVAIRTPSEGHCVGIIVNEWHLVTSCLCVRNSTGHAINPNSIIVIAGDLNMMVPTYRRFKIGATHAFCHPQFNVNRYANDIAVIRVAQQFPLPHNTIDTAIRSNRVVADGTSCRFVGWGSPAAAAGTLPNPVQQALTLPILNRDTCNAVAVHRGNVLENMICAGSILATTNGPCHGNRGGGLFCNNELTGILSYGIGCGAANTPPVFTQVRFHQAWIDQQFTRTDSSYV